MKSILVAAAVCAAAFSAGAFDVSGIQKAIDAASAGGGGTVTVPKGTWETGPFALKNGVTLHLEKGAVLLGCTNSAAYRAAGLSALIHTVGATNVAIEGEGTIDGRGGLITTASRPHLVNFRNCRNVRVEGVTLRCGGSWTIAAGYFADKTAKKWPSAVFSAAIVFVTAFSVIDYVLF